MLIPMMHWPEGWDQPVSLLEYDCHYSHETLENGSQSADRDQMAARLLTAFLDHVSQRTKHDQEMPAASRYVPPRSEERRGG